MFMPNLSTTFFLILLSLLTFGAAARAQNNLTAKANSGPSQPVSATVESDRMRDGLFGPVRRVKTEVAKLSNVNGQSNEQKRVVLETAAYDVKGVKTENQYFPVAGANLTGKEIYKYDERGNISEMTLLNNDGSLLGKEIYKYDYDSLGNWTRMTTSVAVVEGGKVTFEPTEVTYRSIIYYLDENVLKMAGQPGTPTSQPVTSTPQPVTAAATAAAQPVKPEVKTPTPAQGKNGRTVAANRGTGAPLPVVTNNLSNANAASVLSASTGSSSPSQGTPVVIDAPPPPMNTPKPLLKPVSGGVLNGKAVYLPTPSYPDAAKRMRMAGTVTVDVVVDETGKVISAVATSGPTILREVATQAASKAKFSPTMLSGQAVKVSGQINYKFSLSQ